MPEFGPLQVTTTADPSMSRVLRMLARSLAARAPLGVDRVEDVALATSEAFAVVTSSGYRGPVGFTGRLDGGSICVAIARCDDSSPRIDGDAIDLLTQRVLHSVTDEVRIGPEGVHFTIGPSTP